MKKEIDDISSIKNTNEKILLKLKSSENHTIELDKIIIKSILSWLVENDTEAKTHITNVNKK
jgi:hypothetical protein